MKNKAEEIVSNFYNSIGWDTENDITGDARKYEDLRPFAQEYISKCRLRVFRYIPENGENILDMASGPIQFPEYREFSRGFNKRWCVDLSAKALEKAKERIGDHGVFLHGSFFDLPLEENFFDCTLSVHTIYHIDKDMQETAVRKLIAVTKPGHPIVIVYSNPAAWGRWILAPASLILKLFRLFKRVFVKKKFVQELYFHSHPLSWWKRFENEAEIRMYPWRAFDVRHQKLLIPNNFIGKWMLNKLYDLEEKHPDFFVRHFQYPIIVMVKKG